MPPQWRGKSLEGNTSSGGGRGRDSRCGRGPGGSLDKGLSWDGSGGREQSEHERGNPGEGQQETGCVFDSASTLKRGHRRL